MTADPRFRLPLMLLTAVLVHTVVTSQLRIGGARPDILLLVPVAGALVGGRSWGSALGFGAGLASDVFLSSPFGLSALVYCLVGYVVGIVQGGLLDFSRWFTVLAALGASAGGVLLYAATSAVLGQPLVAGRLPVVVVVVAAVNALLSPVALRVVRWALGAGLPARAMR